LVSSKELSAGWRALLRQSTATCDTLDVLRDERLQTQPPKSYRVHPVPGQEKTYDLKETQLFISADIASRHPPPSFRHLGKFRGLQGPALVAADGAAGLDAATLSILELEQDLIRAAVGGLVPLAWRLLGRGARVNAYATSGPFAGSAPLHIACLKGHTDLAMVLVDVFDASLVQLALGGRSAAMCACEAGNEKLAEWLITEGVPADLRDDAGRTVLFYAASAAMPELVSWLMGKQHLAPGFRATDGSTPLSAAVSNNVAKSVVVARQLIEAKANVNKPSNAGRVPLHEAARLETTSVYVFCLALVSPGLTLSMRRAKQRVTSVASLVYQKPRSSCFSLHRGSALKATTTAGNILVKLRRSMRNGRSARRKQS